MLTLTASGSVSDYSDTSSLQQAVATAAGIDPSLVTIAVAASSVMITATLAVPASTTATTVQASLSSALGTATAASTALGVTVEAVPTVAVNSPYAPPPSPRPPPVATGQDALPSAFVPALAACISLAVLLIGGAMLRAYAQKWSICQSGRNSVRDI